MNIVLLGPPGAGKGTQAKRLHAVLRLPHIASGDLFRSIAQQDTPLAREVASYLNSGEYVPDEVTIKMVLDRLSQPDAAAGFLLDGFPRTEVQARALDQALETQSRRVDVALYITAPSELLVQRLSGRIICPNCNAIYNQVTNPPRVDMLCDVCGNELERRQDEALDVVRTRLSTYVRQTTPVVEYYRRRNVLREIDGSHAIEEVEREVDQVVGLEPAV